MLPSLRAGDALRERVEYECLHSSTHHQYLMRPLHIMERLRFSSMPPQMVCCLNCLEFDCSTNTHLTSFSKTYNWSILDHGISIGASLPQAQSHLLGHMFMFHFGGGGCIAQNDQTFHFFSLFPLQNHLCKCLWLPLRMDVLVNCCFVCVMCLSY